MSLAAAATVLLVEDDESTRELYRTALRRNGFRVVAVEDGVAALQFVEATRPDAIVLDVGLPRLGGLDVLGELRANPATRTVPILIVTGSDVASLDETVSALVLRKPLDPDDLVHAIREKIDRGSRVVRAF